MEYILVIHFLCCSEVEATALTTKVSAINNIFLTESTSRMEKGTKMIRFNEIKRLQE
jgi:hypothetical protein